jgi:hypothetical protein
MKRNISGNSSQNDQKKIRNNNDENENNHYSFEEELMMMDEKIDVSGDEENDIDEESRWERPLFSANFSPISQSISKKALPDHSTCEILSYIKLLVLHIQCSLELSVLYCELQFYSYYTYSSHQTCY